jgi:hypothetical protein
MSNNRIAGAAVRAAKALVSAVAAVAFAACGGGSKPPLTSSYDGSVKVSSAGSSRPGNLTAAPGSKASTAPDVSPIVEEPESWFVVAGQSTFFTARVAAQPGDSVEWISTGGASNTAVCGAGKPQDGDLYLCHVENASLAQDGTQFAVQVKRDGVTGFQSKFATLSVAPVPVAPSLESEPSSQTVPAGQSAVFTASATGTGVNPLGATERNAVMRWQWFRDGVPVEPRNAGRSSTLRLATTADEAGSQSVISVKVYNAAGFVASQDVDLVIAAASSVVNGDGGTVPGPAGSSLEVPVNALEGAVTIAITAEPVPVDLLPADYFAVGQMLNLGAPEAALAQPARLGFQGPAVLPAGSQLALLQVDETAAARAAGARTASFSIGAIASCINPQNNSATGRASALVSRLGRVIAAVVPASACPDVEPRIPPDVVPSTTQAPCQKSDDFTVTSGVGDDAFKTLVSRHVDCRQSELRFVTLSMDLKETISNTGEARYSQVSDPNALLPDDVVRNVPYATALLKSRMSVHGSSEGLSKRVTIAIKMLSLVKDINYTYYAARGAPSPSTFIVKPEIGACITYDGSDAPTCTVPGKPEITVSRSAVATRASNTAAAPDETFPTGVDFSMTFKWTKSTDQTFDTETFRININRFEYKFPGGSYFLARSGTPLQTKWFWGDLGESPKIRCDRKLADDGGASSGCVFLDAAPVVDLRKYPKAADVTQHVKDAQDGTSQSIAPEKSPGQFKFQAGSIAVADSSVVGSQALQMMKDQSKRDINRRDSCARSNSLISDRPYHGSRSCGEISPGSGVPPSSCNCDEYPMASTWQGAGVDAGNRPKVSVKYILGRDNSSAGGALGNFYKQFYTRERVLDLTDYGAVPLRPIGDYFWVNARDKLAPAP